MTTPLQVTTTALIGYIDGASDLYDADYDAELFGLGADALFTVLDERKLGIQGKSFPFLENDRVKVGTSHYENGTYVFSVGQREGVFAKGQPIYLKDLHTGIFTNLAESAYSFEASKGLTEGRFEILYQDETLLRIDSSSKERITVYRDGADFVVNSSEKIIADIEVFDSSGRLLLKLKPNQKEVRIEAGKFINGIYVLKVTSGSLNDQSGIIWTRRIRK